MRKTPRIANRLRRMICFIWILCLLLNNLMPTFILFNPTCLQLSGYCPWRVACRSLSQFRWCGLSAETCNRQRKSSNLQQACRNYCNIQRTIKSSCDLQQAMKKYINTQPAKRKSSNLQKLVRNPLIYDQPVGIIAFYNHPLVSIVFTTSQLEILQS